MTFNDSLDAFRAATIHMALYRAMSVETPPAHLKGEDEHEDEDEDEGEGEGAGEGAIGGEEHASSKNHCHEAHLVEVSGPASRTASAEANKKTINTMQ